MKKLLYLAILAILLVLPSGCISSKAPTADVDVGQSVEVDGDPIMGSDPDESIVYPVESMEPVEKESETGTGYAEHSLFDGVSMDKDEIKWRLIAREVSESTCYGTTIMQDYKYGLAGDWLEIYFRQKAEDMNVYMSEEFPITNDRLYGITYDLAEEAGWGEAWKQAMDEMDFPPSPAPTSAPKSTKDNGKLSESQLKSICEREVISVVTDWINSHNASAPKGFRIISVNTGTSMLAEIRYSGSTATFTAPVDYWMKGGSPTGTAIVTVIVDVYDGTVIHSSVES